MSSPAWRSDMATTEPTTELDSRFSSPEATPTAWADAVDLLEKAEIYWLSTVRPDGRPHVTPLIAVWLDDALYVTTAPDERKAKNLAQNAHCIVTTGCNTMSNGLDLAIEGDAVRVTDNATLQRVANIFASKYGTEVWNFTVRNGAFHHEAGEALVFVIESTTAFGFGKGETFSQTRWRFRKPST